MLLHSSRCSRLPALDYAQHKSNGKDEYVIISPDANLLDEDDEKVEKKEDSLCIDLNLKIL